MRTRQRRIDVKPMKLEDQFAFTVRAHKKLRSKIRDSEKRNKIIWRAWEKSKGLSEEEQIAAEKFNSKSYDTMPIRCLFVEHERADGNGEVKVCGPPDLVKIIRTNNENIRESNAFPAISDGHTDDDGRNEPELLGFVGPMRLGQVGRDKPKWGIFAPEYGRAEHRKTLRSKPRRSVEVIRNKRTGETHIDPVAALGTTAPRLSMPIHYEAAKNPDLEINRFSFGDDDTYTIERYEMTGTNNTFLRSETDDNTTPERYQETDMSQQLIAQVVEAVSNLPEMKHIRGMMEKEQAKAKGSEQFMDAEDPETDMMGPEEEIGDVESDDFSNMGDMELEEEQFMDDEDPETDELLSLLESDDEEEEETQQFGKGRYSSRYDSETETARFQMLQRDIAKLQETNAALMQEAVKQRKENIDTKRRAVIDQVADKFSTFVDRKEEYEKCLYSSGSDMDNKAFKAHIVGLKKIGQRVASTVSQIPSGESQIQEVSRFNALSDQEVEFEMYSANRVKELNSENLAKGQYEDYDTLRAKAHTEWKSASPAQKEKIRKSF